MTLRRQSRDVANWALALLLALTACSEKPKAPLPALKPVPLEPLLAEVPALDGGDERDTLYTVRPFTFTGEAIPADALHLEIAGLAIHLGADEISLDGLKPKLTDKTVVLLSFDEDTYLAQVQALLALLEDAGVKVWLQSPDVPALGWPVKLRDENGFAAWVDEMVPGKLRVIQRADGFELQTNMGKLPGGDPKGPTVPVRGGKLDLVTLQKGLDQVKKRFLGAPDLCFMPTFGTPMRDVTRAVATNTLNAEQVVFAEVSLVYPRPKK